MLFAHQLFVSLSLLALSASYSLAAPAKNNDAASTSTCSVQKTVTVTSSSSSASGTSTSSAATLAAVTTTSGSASSTSTSSSSSGNKSSSKSKGKSSGSSSGSDESSLSSSVAVTSTTETSSSAVSTATGNVAATGLDFGSCSTPEISFAAGLDGRKETAFVPTDTTSFNHGSADGIDVITSFICQQLQDKCKANAAAISTCQTATSAADAASTGTGAQADAFNAAFGTTTDFASVAVISNTGSTVQAGSSASTTSAAGSTTSSTAANVNAASTTSSASGTTSTGSSGSKTSTSTSTSSDDDDDAQSATTLAADALATGFELDGQESPTTGQVASLTSKNNFINFCLTVDKPITNGQQIKTGSCNPAPMGMIAATTNMPSSKFVSPKNGDSISSNTTFTISMAINNVETGNFVNAQANYYSAPQQVNSDGNIIGHSHVYIQQLDSLSQTTPVDPTTFAFFKGINEAADNGVVTADVTGGLAKGFYRMGSINSAANHQPVLVAVAQHGALDDMVYFTVE